MSAKRALIVDDSRSARMILSRMLETYGLEVDTAESGEQALDFLRNARPDVVFMDHLMPGMDGFDAIRAMRANAQTAAIPVMMYTSQEGEHYLQQARKAGAMGVLSKTLKPADVARALYELRLLPDRREVAAAPQFAPSLEQRAPAMAMAGGSRTPSNDATRAPAADTSIAPGLRTLLDEQHAELQQELQANFSALSEHLDQKLRAAVLQLSVPVPPPPSESQAKTTRSWFAAALVLVALVPTAVIALLYWRTLNDNRTQLQESTARLAMVVTEQQTQIEQLRTELRRRQEGAEPLAIASDLSVAVPYGEPPFAGARVQRLRALLDRLQAENFQGKVVATNYVGDFCLSGAAATGYAAARADVPARRCDLIGNPFEDMLSAAERQSPEFAALLNATGASKIRIEIQFGGRKPAAPYPAQNEQLTAGEWNAVAARNNRVEFVATPAS